MEQDSVVADASSVTITREQRKFPLCPKGTHIGTCIKAELKDLEFQGRTNTVLSLTWELDSKFKDEETEEEKPFRVFDTLSLFFGPKARLGKAFKELTNEAIDQLVRQKKFKKNGKDFIQETFEYKAFEGMVADITVTHVEGKSDPTKLYPKIMAYTCKEAQQKANADLIFVDDGASE